MIWSEGLCTPVPWLTRGEGVRILHQQALADLPPLRIGLISEVWILTFHPKLSSLTMIYPHEYFILFWLLLSSWPWQLPIAVNAEAYLHIMWKSVFFSQLRVLSTLNFDWMPPWVHVLKEIRNSSLAFVLWIMYFFNILFQCLFLELFSMMLPHNMKSWLSCNSTAWSCFVLIHI